MIGHLLDGRYRIVQSLGIGGQSEAYLAEDIRLYNAKRVVKRLRPAAADAATLKVARRLFASEAKVLSQLGMHDQLPELFDHFEINHEFFLVQSFIEGHPLSQELPKGQKHTGSEVITLLLDILQPLSILHQHHVIHRDLKPPNLIRRKRDHKIVLIDFGAVKDIRSQMVDGQGHTRHTVVVGTDGYMPSEQSMGTPVLSSDIYAVGMIGIQALTGVMPRQLSRNQNLEILWHEYADADPQLMRILDKMVLYDCRQRYRSAVEALEALSQLSTANWKGYAPTVVSMPPTEVSIPPTEVSIPIPAVETPPISTAPSQPLVDSSPSASELTSHLTQQNVKLRWLVKGALTALFFVVAGSGFYAYTLARTDKPPSEPIGFNGDRADAATGTRASADDPPAEVPSQHSYETFYKQAIAGLDSPEHRLTFDNLFLAAETAIAMEQVPEMLDRLDQDAAGVFNRITIGHPEWAVLLDALKQPDEDSFLLTYERAKLNISNDSQHQREWMLLTQAAQIAIANGQAVEMLARLNQDEPHYFQRLAMHEEEWTNLTRALKQQDKTLLTQR